MDLTLEGKRALVCGSTQGLGLAVAKELALLGCEVILFSRNENKLGEALKMLDTGAGQSHSYLVADFAHPPEVEKAITGCLESGKTVQILVNNTGGPKPGKLSEATTEAFIQGFQSHLICNQLLAQAVIPGMKAAGYGRIVNVISTSVRQPLPGLAVSNTIRGAVAAWSKTLSMEVGEYGITVNNVLPGFTRTSRYASLVKSRMESSGQREEEIEAQLLQDIPLKRIGTPSEFGAVAAFLCSPAASYITGVSLPVDGGKTSAI